MEAPLSGYARHIVLMSISAGLLAGCVKDGGASVEPSAPQDLYVQNLDTAQEKYGPEVPAGADVRSAAAKSEIEKLLTDRSAEYARVAQEARQRGIAGGAVRGGVIGLLIDADPATMIGGAVIGGMIGAASADKVVSQIVLEHQNYILRRWSLEKVIEAARTDTSNTRFDLLLSNRYLTERSSLGFAEQSNSVGLLVSFKERAMDRAMALREVMPVYATTDEARDLLEAELEAQTAMVAQIGANLTRMGASQ